MKKRAVVLLLCTVIGVSLAGCGENVGISEQINVTESTAQPESEKMPGLEQAAPEEGASEEVQPVELEECALLGSNFANSLYVTDMTYQLNGGNVMFSPLSLNFALGLVLAGTDGDSPTRAAIENYLNSSEYSAFARSYMKYAEEVSAREVPEGSTMENHFDIANGIWVNREYSLLEKYQSTVRESYGAEVESLDFADANGVADTVNHWVNQKTQSMIPEILNPELITEEAAAVLTNAIYFQSPWLSDWKPSEVDKRFTNLDGSTCEPAFLDSSCSDYFENDYATAFAKKYANGLEFIGILPKDTGEFALRDLDIEGLLETRQNVKTITVMPELNFSTDIKLDPMLNAMGMGVMYTNEADITEMCDEELKVAAVLQKTKLELDAKGTKAAAATAVVMYKATAALTPELPQQVTLDRPFAFLIYDAENQVPVFMGKVTNLNE